MNAAGLSGWTGAVSAVMVPRECRGTERGGARGAASLAEGRRLLVQRVDDRRAVIGDGCDLLQGCRPECFGQRRVAERLRRIASAEQRPDQEVDDRLCLLLVLVDLVLLLV